MSVFLSSVALPFLGELVALFAISVLIAYLCYRIRLVPIAGFLIAGVLVGPGGFGIVDDIEMVNSTAEIGVILLLFTIGLEFRLSNLARMGRSIRVGGTLQVTLTLVAVMVLLVPAGVSLNVAIFTGFLVALSSTTVVLSLLADRRETDTPVGRISLSILIFQDLAIIGMVLLIPVLGNQGGSIRDVLFALGGALVLIVVVLFLARRIVPWILERIMATRRNELFLLAVVTVCFGTAYLTSLVGVSLALGAFLAGLIVSESKHSEYALSEILPLRTIFNAIFFVSVGMLLDVAFFVANLPLVLGITFAVLAVKFVATTATVLQTGYPLRIAAGVGFGIAQIGEFSFVLEREGSSVGLTPAGLGTMGGQVFIAVTVLLMIVTPFLMSAGPHLAERLGRRFGRSMAESERSPREGALETLEDHVIVVGFGTAGSRLAHVLRDTQIPYVVVELNPVLVTEAEREGILVVPGDATGAHLQSVSGVERAKMCVIAINDAAAARRIIQVARHLNPTLQIVARARYVSEIEQYQGLGADIVVPEELETAVRLFTQVLGAYMVPPEEISRQVNLIRSDDYRVLRGSIQEAHLMVLQGLDEEGLHTRAVAVRPGAAVAERTLAELQLRSEYGISVLAVRREGRTIGNPAGKFTLRAGDRLVLVGTADQFQRAAPLFRDAPVET